VKDRVDTFADFRSLAIQVQAIFFFLNSIRSLNIRCSQPAENFGWGNWLFV